MLCRDNVHADRVVYQTPGNRSLTQVHTNVHCCHWLPKDLSNESYQIYQRAENLKFQLETPDIKDCRLVQWYCVGFVTTSERMFWFEYGPIIFFLYFL